MTERLSMMSFNIHGCVGRGRREAPEATLEVIRQAEADVVALQEVQDDDEADITFLQGLQELDYMEVIYGETFRKAVGPYGNVLMSRYPVVGYECIDISVGSVEPRGAIRALLDTPCGRVRVTATHLGLGRSERRAQINQLLEDAQASDFGLEVLMGDLNEWNPASRKFRRLAAAFPHISPRRSFPARLPVFALDRILLRGDIESVRFGRIDSFAGRTASDHRPVIAEIEC